MLSRVYSRGLSSVVKSNKNNMTDKVSTSLKKQIKCFKDNILAVPMVINGRIYHNSFNDKYGHQLVPYDRNRICSSFPMAGQYEMKKAVDATYIGKELWNSISFNRQMEIFRKAADLATGKYKSRLIASAMLGQAKTAYQAEEDSVHKFADYLRNAVEYKEKLFQDYIWGDMPGYIASMSSYKLNSINSCVALIPLLMGNAVIWRPSKNSMLNNYIVYEMMMEAGVPPETIQFIPCDRNVFIDTFAHEKRMSGFVHNESDLINRRIYGIINNMYESYVGMTRVLNIRERINYNFIMPNETDVDKIVDNVIKSSFNYAGQIWTSRRLYIPDTLYDDFKNKFEERMKNAVGSPEDNDILMSAVINKSIFREATEYIERWYNKIVFGGECRDYIGYYISPTIIVEDDLNSKIWDSNDDDIYAPILLMHVYKPDDFGKAARHCANYVYKNRGDQMENPIFWKEISENKYNPSYNYNKYMMYFHDSAYNTKEKDMFEMNKLLYDMGRRL